MERTTLHVIIYLIGSSAFVVSQTDPCFSTIPQSTTLGPYEIAQYSFEHTGSINCTWAFTALDGVMDLYFSEVTLLTASDTLFNLKGPTDNAEKVYLQSSSVSLQLKNGNGIVKFILKVIAAPFVSLVSTLDVTENKQVLASPVFPDPYPKNRVDNWLLKTVNCSEGIKIEIVLLDVPVENDTCGASLTFTSQSSQTGPICMTKAFQPSSNSMFSFNEPEVNVTFNASNHDTGTFLGFVFNYYSVPIQDTHIRECEVDANCTSNAFCSILGCKSECICNEGFTPFRGHCIDLTDPEPCKDFAG